MTDVPGSWQQDNNGNVGLIGACYSCHTPADEWPETLELWVVQLIVIDTITDPSNQRTLKCTDERHCPGHPIETHLFCLACQKEDKHHARDEASQHNRPKS